MLIRSQGKEILANMEGSIAIEILGDGKGHATMYWKDSYVLGVYSSKEKSMKAHGLYSEENKNGYKIDFFHCPVSQLDEKEREYIQKAIDAGWIVKNKTGGGQDEGKEKIADYRPAKGYRDGIQQGKKTLSRDLSHIIDTHLQITLKPEKQHNKTSIKAFEKFREMLDERNYEK